MAILGLLAVNLAVLLAFLTILWAISVRLRNASIIDIFWGPACAFPAVLTLIRIDGASPRDLLLTALVCVWAGRLAFYLAYRNSGHGEDIRYQAMRAAQPSDAAFARWSLPFVFWLQGGVAWFVSLPVQIGQIGPDRPVGVIALLGAAIFAIGLAFESIGDWQLLRFKSEPANKGKLMTRGLWSWTRHPNYFGDAMVWCGLTLIALDGPLGLWTVLSPAVMAYFLVNVSGKALTEKLMSKKYPEYEDYKTRVSGFIPRPPKR